MEDAGVAGRVEVEVVVDTSGHVDPSLLRVIQSSHRIFEDPARRALLATQFPRPVHSGQPVSGSLRAIFEFTLPPVPDTTPSLPQAAYTAAAWGYTFRVGRAAVPRTSPPPQLSTEDSLGALRAALLKHGPPKADTAGRVLCLSLAGKSLDSTTLAEFRRRRRETVPITACPPTYSSMFGASRQRPEGALDPDVLAIGPLTAWTHDLLVIPIKTARRTGGTSMVCDLIRIADAPGWRVDRCRQYRNWASFF